MFPMLHGVVSSVSGSTVTISDEFTAADTTTLNGRTPSPINTPGNTWTVAAGTWQINSNKASVTTPTLNVFQIAHINTGASDVKLTANVTLPASGSWAPGFVVRWTNSSNYWLLLILNGNLMQIRRIQAGASTTVAAISTVEPAYGSTISMTATLSGNVTTFRVGVDELSFTSTFNNTATIHGLTEFRSSTYGSNVFDDFVCDTDATMSALPHVRLLDLPVARNQHGFEECGGKLYAVAGELSAGVTNTVYEYDPVGNTWTSKTNLPISVQSPILRAVSGKLYLIGGLNNSTSTHYATVYEYDPVANTWTAKTSAPTAREDMGSAVHDGKIYVFGGLKPPGNTVTKVLEIYDPVADSWSVGADMPDFKQLGDFGASYNGKIYAVGATNTMTGYPNLTPVTTVYEYDPIGDSWATLASIPVSTCYKEVVELSGKLYVVSGCTSSTTTYTAATYSYNIATNQWTQEVDAPFGARGIGLATYSGNIYSCGGFNNGAVKHLYRLVL